MSVKVALRDRLIRTPLQEPAVLLRSALDWRRFTQPQFNRLRGEDARMLRIMKRVLRSDSNCIEYPYEAFNWFATAGTPAGSAGSGADVAHSGS